MRVLFLALGGNRRLAVTAESRAIAAVGDRPTVLVAGLARWADEAFAPDVEVVPLSRYPRHWPLAAEHLLLYRWRRSLLRRPRAISLYTRLIANPVRRWLIRPLYRRLWPEGIHRQLDAFLAGCEQFDAVVVTDARSFPAARRVVDRLTAAHGTPPRVAFRTDAL